MLKYHLGLKVAEAVLKCLDIITKKEYRIEAYQNAREQGYMIIDNEFNLDKVAYVTSSRNSDKIVVYIGNYSNQGLSEDAYNNSQDFNPTDFMKAAEYIDNNIG